MAEYSASPLPILLEEGGNLMKQTLLKWFLGQPAPKENAERSALLAHLEEAKRELLYAEQDFEMSTSDTVDLCTYRLKTARERCNYLLRLAKSMQ